MQTNKPLTIIVTGFLCIAFLAIWTGRDALPRPPDATILTELPSGPDADFLSTAVPFIARWEGLRLEAYRDVVGIPTICYGETKGVSMGDTATQEECDAMLAREVLSYRDRLRPAFNHETIAQRLPVSRDAAFTSFAYNVGVAGASRSTAIRRLNAGNISGACAALTWWNKAGGRVIRGLANRRSSERDLCMKGEA